ncbi:MAG: phosphoribosyl-AMP cyclohydrolase [Candidatus Zeuxoniibacter abyssi]|nr:MAG: phosphoribosyl-AMP cyclohydrolase [Candidatus Persebacteraceae bacterium AB1(2)]
MNEKKFFKKLETADTGKKYPLSEALAALRFNTDGLLPVITQCADSGQVLMLAWMNRTAINDTLASGEMTYYSRSRKTLWRKGETSGCRQKLLALSIDCDGDAILATVKQTGAACHTGRQSCFYVTLGKDKVKIK